MKHQEFQFLTRTSCLFGVVVLIIALVTSPEAHAQTDYDPTALSRLLGGPLFWSLVCYLTRKRAFGGWLLYFYVGLLSGILFIFAGLAMSYEALSPTFWIDRIGYYLLYLVYIIPDHIVTLLLWLFAIRLLFKSQRNRKNLSYFRKLLLVGVLCSCISLIILFVFGAELFNDPSPIADILYIAFVGLTAIYFYRSQRVQMVLGDQDWDYQKFRSIKEKKDQPHKWSA